MGECVNFREVSYGSVCKLKLEFVLDVRKGHLYTVVYHNITC